MKRSALTTHVRVHYCTFQCTVHDLNLSHVMCTYVQWWLAIEQTVLVWHYFEWLSWIRYYLCLHGTTSRCTSHVFFKPRSDTLATCLNHLTRRRLFLMPKALKPSEETHVRQLQRWPCCNDFVCREPMIKGVYTTAMYYHLMYRFWKSLYESSLTQRMHQKWSFMYSISSQSYCLSMCHWQTT